MLDFKPFPVGKERLVIGNMTMMGVECFGKLSLLMHFQGDDTHVRLTNVAYMPRVQCNLLHAVMSKCRVTMDTEGVHMLGASVFCVHSKAASYFSARITDPPMENLVLAPGKQQRIDNNDLHVVLAHAHTETLRETAHQHLVEVVGGLVPCVGCSEAERVRCFRWFSG